MELETINKLYLELSQIATATTDSELKLLDKINEVKKQREELVAALEECRQAFDFTRQYIGEEKLPAIKGWSWFDADTKAREALASVKESK